MPDRPPDALRGVLTRLRLASLLERFPERPLRALFMFVNGFVSIALLAALAAVSGTPVVFPSLGPTAFLQFVSPLTPGSSPRNSVCGHAIGIACGYGSIVFFGVEAAPATANFASELHRVLAPATALALTGALMVLTRTEHPPAAATTLIIALGVVTSLEHLLFIELGVCCLTLQAIAFNRLAGLDYPLWSAPP